MCYSGEYELCDIEQEVSSLPSLSFLICKVGVIIHPTSLGY